ncbi:MAG: pyridoxamine 5'-phosphate oxidase family protein [Chloroflexi bacterium]|nr:pyridoxamine 5'-phosphate oxidase family protein [Chloroflexota bacterium]
MSQNTSERPLNQVRRHDRAVTDEAWIVSFLQRAPFGVLATCRDGQPFTVARNFAYDADVHAIYLHGAKKGRTFENVQANGRANFNVSEMGRLLPAERAMDFSVLYSGVVIFGNISVVTDAEEAKRGLQLLLNKLFPDRRPGVDYEPITDVDLKVTAVFRLDIEHWSGKQKKAPKDLPL